MTNPEEAATTIEAARTDGLADCYGDAYRIAVGRTKLPFDVSKMDETYVVHGEVRITRTNGKTGRGGHAWIEFRAGKWWFAYDPQVGHPMDRDEYYAAAAAVPGERYTFQECVRAVVRNRHYGPFS